MRGELLGLNRELLRFFRERKDLVSKIQQHKAHAAGREWTAFDPERERKLFAELAPDLESLGQRELQAFSLLMEEHAGAPTAYPPWSEGVHLDELPTRAHHRINPLLLEVVQPQVFLGLRLTPSFGFLRRS